MYTALIANAMILYFLILIPIPSAATTFSLIAISARPDDEWTMRCFTIRNRTQSTRIRIAQLKLLLNSKPNRFSFGIRFTPAIAFVTAFALQANMYTICPKAMVSRDRK